MKSLKKEINRYTKNREIDVEKQNIEANIRESKYNARYKEIRRYKKQNFRLEQGEVM